MKRKKGDPMPSLLTTTHNTRAILPDSLRLIRSDAPVSLSERDLQWLLENRITTVVDLREGRERDRRPCPLERHPSFRYLSMPVTGGNRIPETPELVPQSYLQMVDGQMERILRTVLHAETNVLYFCTAGKDRTGVVSALLLRHLGYDDEYIIADYLRSAENLREVLLDHIRRYPHVNPEVITPRRIYMEAFLTQFSGLRIEKAVESDMGVPELQQVRLREL